MIGGKNRKKSGREGKNPDAGGKRVSAGKNWERVSAGEKKKLAARKISGREKIRAWRRNPDANGKRVSVGKKSGHEGKKPDGGED